MQTTIRYVSIMAIAFVMSITPKCNSNSNSNREFITGWDSGELQTQIGDQNSNKRKLVMRVWYNYRELGNGWYEWFILYSIWAEDHNKLGSGWHQVNKLSSFTFNAVIELPNGGATINESKNLVGVSSPYERAILGRYKTIGLPVFKSKTATGSRAGGPSGLSITWPK